MGNFYTDVIQRDGRLTSTISCRDMGLLEPSFRAKVQSLLNDAKSAGTPLIVTETYRSVQRQQMLFHQHATQLQTVGVHHYGLACDFAKLVNGEAEWGGSWSALGIWSARYGLVWGGDWGEPTEPHTFRDYDHVQGVTLAQQPALFAGTFYPS